MDRKLLIVTALLTLSSMATALVQSDPAAKPPSLLENLFWSVLPILFIVVVVWWVFIRAIKRVQARGLEHQQRVIQLLERIASAVESKDKNLRS